MAIISTGSTTNITALGINGAPNVNVQTSPNAARITQYGTDGTSGISIGKVGYTALSAAFTSPATPNDVAILNGSAYKTIRVLRVGITTTQSAMGKNAWYLIMRSAVNTSGGINIMTPNQSDTNDPGATATAQYYTTSNPTPGTAVGTVWSGYLNSPIITTSGMSSAPRQRMFIIDFLDLFGQPLTLRGAAQGLAVNFNGAALPGGLSTYVFFQWTEE